MADEGACVNHGPIAAEMAATMGEMLCAGRGWEAGRVVVRHVPDMAPYRWRCAWCGSVNAGGRVQCAQCGGPN